MSLYVKEGQKPDNLEKRLDVNLLVNTGQRQNPFIDTAFISQPIKAQSFVSCLQEPARARSGKQLTEWHFPQL